MNVERLSNAWLYPAICQPVCPRQGGDYAALAPQRWQMSASPLGARENAGVEFVPEDDLKGPRVSR